MALLPRLQAGAFASLAATKLASLPHRHAAEKNICLLLRLIGKDKNRKLTFFSILRKFFPTVLCNG
jgi:hypothetical protein